MLEFTLDDFMTRAFLAATGLALITGPLGCFLIWRRMAFFGDTLSHAALLGVGIGVLLHTSWYIGIMAVCGLLALILSRAMRQKTLSYDSWLCILSYGSLAFGMIIIQTKGQRIDPESILFGDILSVSQTDIFWIFACVLITALLLKSQWRKLLLMTFNEDIAQVSGVQINLTNDSLMLLVALSVAVALKAVGALLIPALLIIPAATTALFVRSPESMILWASGLALLTQYTGLTMAYHINTPSGPTIIAVSSVVFVLTWIWKTISTWR